MGLENDARHGNREDRYGGDRGDSDPRPRTTHGTTDEVGGQHEERRGGGRVRTRETRTCVVRPWTSDELFHPAFEEGRDEQSGDPEPPAAQVPVRQRENQQHRRREENRFTT